jgi:hypothetical protein
VIEDLTPAAIAESDVQTALVPVAERAALALASTKTEEHLKALATKHSTITVVKDRAGREQAHNAAMELLKARTAIEKVSKMARDDANKFSKAVIAEEDRLIAITAAEEKRLFAVRDAWDAEQERIRKEKAEAEERRVQRILAAIGNIRAIPGNMLVANATQLADAIKDLREIQIDDSYEEFMPQAELARAESLAKLAELRTAADAREAEAAKLAAERAELERARAEQAAQAEELARQVRELQEANARAAAEVAAAAQRAIDEANAKSKREAEQREVFLRQQQDAFAAEKAAAQAKMDEQQRALDEQKADIAKELADKAAAEAAVKAKREAEEAAARKAKEAADRKAREDEALSFAARVVAVVAEAFEIDPEEAEDYIQRAAETLNAKVAA